MTTKQIHNNLKEAVNPAHTALIVIDVQNDFYIPRYEPMVGRIKELLEAARDAGVFVIYVQNSVLPGLSNSASEISRRQRLGLSLDVTVAGSKGEEIVAAISPKDGEHTVRKHRLNAFAGTSLDLLLQGRGIETIVVTGVATHGCVTGTSYAAQGLNYYVVVAQDCVDSWKADLHEAALHVLRNTMNYAATNDALIQAWDESNRKNRR